MELDYTVLNELSWIQKDKRHVRKARGGKNTKSYSRGQGRERGGRLQTGALSSEWYSVTTVHNLGTPEREMTRSPNTRQ